MKGTTRTTQDLRENFEHGLQLLKTLRDEIVVDVHLASMEAKTEWRKLEHRFAFFESGAQGTPGVEALEQFGAALRAFRDTLRKAPQPR